MAGRCVWRLADRMRRVRGGGDLLPPRKEMSPPYPIFRSFFDHHNDEVRSKPAMPFRLRLRAQIVPGGGKGYGLDQVTSAVQNPSRGRSRRFGGIGRNLCLRNYFRFCKLIFGANQTSFLLRALRQLADKGDQAKRDQAHVYRLPDRWAAGLSCATLLCNYKRNYPAYRADRLVFPERMHPPRDKHPFYSQRDF